MSLLDKMKQNLRETTGYGLNAQEQYQRAYQKGVFIKDYNAAAENFNKAFERFLQENNAEMAQRSRANSTLYSLLNSKNWASMDDAAASLGHCQK